MYLDCGCVAGLELLGACGISLGVAGLILMILVLIWWFWVLCGGFVVGLWWVCGLFRFPGFVCSSLGVGADLGFCGLVYAWWFALAVLLVVLVIALLFAASVGLV